LDGNEKLKKPDFQEDTTKYPYQSLIGSLMYLAVSTRPDISYTVSALGQFNQNHGEEHWNTHHARTKHIDVRHHFVREAYEEGKIEPRYIPTEEMVADVFTKSLFGPKHNVCTEWLGVSDLSP
jgi:hypothetical protein